ncbi:hypothetical protein KY284_026802 [Solanum tuberosum]|nr:hypothetical protein KY284_026802 [Solanum tuberosum]
MTCSKCHQVGHNKKTCKSVPSQQPRQQPFQQPYQQPFQHPRQQPSQPSVSQSSTRHSTFYLQKLQELKEEKSKQIVLLQGHLLHLEGRVQEMLDLPGRSSERVISSGTTLKDASQTNVDLGFKPPGLKWKGK